jgi:hypothetical protein
MKTIQEEGEPYLFQIKIFGISIKVDSCLLFRLVAGSIILFMTLVIIWIVLTDGSIDKVNDK